MLICAIAFLETIAGDRCDKDLREIKMIPMPMIL